MKRATGVKYEQEFCDRPEVLFLLLLTSCSDLLCLRDIEDYENLTLFEIW